MYMIYYFMIFKVVWILKNCNEQKQLYFLTIYQKPYPYLTYFLKAKSDRVSFVNFLVINAYYKCSANLYLDCVPGKI